MAVGTIGTIQSLANARGRARFSHATSGSDSFFQREPGTVDAETKELIHSILSEDPRLKDIKIKKAPKGVPGAYSITDDEIYMGVNNPNVLAHELGHAQNVRNTKLYGKLLSVVNAANRVNQRASLPAMLAIRALVKDKDTRNEAFNILSGASAALAAPGLAEEFGASISAFKHAPDKWEATKDLLPAFLSHALASSVPVATYQLGKHI